MARRRRDATPVSQTIESPACFRIGPSSDRPLQESVLAWGVSASDSTAKPVPIRVDVSLRQGEARSGGLFLPRPPFQEHQYSALVRGEQSLSVRAVARRPNRVAF